ncbi:MAG: histidine phosphatase family protein [Flavobacteriales bacterium]|nr:histidine phosphatase family protein [Flavobacteriales bacterium]
MRTLYLTRHAKSSWDDPHGTDHERPLNRRGERDAPFMAERFRSRSEPLDLLVSSTALRALSTARTFAGTLGIPTTEIVERPEIYLADHRTLLRLLNSLPDAAHRIMLFGHDPGLNDLVNHLAEENVAHMPTCCTARLDLDVERWEEVGMGAGRIAWIDFPKRHPELETS